MWLLTFPITEYSTTDLNGSLATALSDQYVWHVHVCPAVCDSLGGALSCRQHSWGFEWTWVPPLGLCSRCQVIMVQMDTQMPAAACGASEEAVSAPNPGAIKI